MSQRIDALLLDRVGAALAPGAKLLDLPAGEGDLTRRFEAAGYAVTAADRFPGGFRPERPRPVCADMNLPLPFASGGFDAVICQEGIEHLENPAVFLRECDRVIRKGGFVWLTTPNFMDLSSRLAFLLSGMKSFHAGFPNEETTVWGRQGGSIYHGHAFTLPFFQIRYLLRTSGFEDVTLYGASRSNTSLALYPFVRPFCGWLADRAWRRRRRKQHGEPSAAVVEELRRHATSRDLLCSKKILVQAVRGA